jgi:hypothetical protein
MTVSLFLCAFGSRRGVVLSAEGWRGFGKIPVRTSDTAGITKKSSAYDNCRYANKAVIRSVTPAKAGVQVSPEKIEISGFRLSPE